MNLKNKRYMRNTEFTAKQLWLKFTDAVGIVLREMAETKKATTDWLKKFIKDCRTGWKKNNIAPRQLELIFRNSRGQFTKPKPTQAQNLPRDPQRHDIHSQEFARQRPAGYNTCT